MQHQRIDSAVHRALLLGIVRDGCAPALGALAAVVGGEETAVAASLERLEANHGVVLHPGTTAPWVVHPFSLVPTAFWIEGERRGWWAPCAWCAMGVAALVGGRARVHSRLGGEREPVVVAVDGERVEPASLVVHFATPVARAWENVHAFCAATLLFRDAADVARWCAAHGRSVGDVVPIVKVARLGREWYGRHLDAEWRKWTIEEAAALFARCGLAGPTWELPTATGRF